MELHHREQVLSAPAAAQNLEALPGTPLAATPDRDDKLLAPVLCDSPAAAPSRRGSLPLNPEDTPKAEDQGLGLGLGRSPAAVLGRCGSLPLGPGDNAALATGPGLGLGQAPAHAPLPKAQDCGGVPSEPQAGGGDAESRQGLQEVADDSAEVPAAARVPVGHVLVPESQADSPGQQADLSEQQGGHLTEQQERVLSGLPGAAEGPCDAALIGLEAEAKKSGLDVSSHSASAAPPSAGCSASPGHADVAAGAAQAGNPNDLLSDSSPSHKNAATKAQQAGYEAGFTGTALLQAPETLTLNSTLSPCKTATARWGQRGAASSADVSPRSGAARAVPPGETAAAPGAAAEPTGPGDVLAGGEPVTPPELLQAAGSVALGRVVPWAGAAEADTQPLDSAGRREVGAYSLYYIVDQKLPCMSAVHVHNTTNSPKCGDAGPQFGQAFLQNAVLPDEPMGMLIAKGE